MKNSPDELVLSGIIHVNLDQRTSTPDSFASSSMSRLQKPQENNEAAEKKKGTGLVHDPT